MYCLHTCRSIQSWKLAEIKRDDYAPNTPGQRQWEMDRKKWLANRLVEAVKVGGVMAGTILCRNIVLQNHTAHPALGGSIYAGTGCVGVGVGWDAANCGDASIAEP
jgi:hypothetical protein